MAQPSSACLAALDAVSIALNTSTLSLSDYVVTLLKYQALWDHPSTVDLVNNTTKIMTGFLRPFRFKDFCLSLGQYHHEEEILRGHQIAGFL